MNEKILVIDDEPLILATIERALIKIGYAVKATSHAAEFIDTLSSDTFALLIMDVHLGGIDKDNLMDKVKELSPQAKILVISGSIEGLPGRYYLPKPFKIDELRQRVREILAEP